MHIARTKGLSSTQFHTRVVKWTQTPQESTFTVARKAVPFKACVRTTTMQGLNYEGCCQPPFKKKGPSHAQLPPFL